MCLVIPTSDSTGDGTHGSAQATSGTKFPPWMLELTDLKLPINKKVLLIIVFKCFCFPVIIHRYITEEIPVSLSKSRDTAPGEQWIILLLFLN